MSVTTQEVHAVSVDTVLRSGAAARRLGISQMHVGELVKAGVLPVAARTPDGWNLFDPQVVEQVAAERAANPPRPGRKPRIPVEAVRPSAVA